MTLKDIRIPCSYTQGGATKFKQSFVIMTKSKTHRCGLIKNVKKMDFTFLEALTNLTSSTMIFG